MSARVVSDHPMSDRRVARGRGWPASAALAVTLALLGSLFLASCGDDTVDPKDVTGTGADLVIFMSAEAPQDQIDKVKLELEVAKQGGEVVSYDFFNSSDTAKIIGAIADGGEIDPTKKIPSLFTVVLAIKSDVESKATAFRLLAGVESVSTDGLPTAPSTDSTVPPTSSVPVPTAPG